PRKSVSMGPEPRYGTCSRSTPAIILNSSPATWEVEPLPNDAMVILVGLALAWATNSGTVLAGTDGCTSRTSAERLRPATIARSRFKLTLSLSNSVALTEFVAVRSEEHTSELQ